MQPLVAVRSWPGPDVRERQLFGVSMRTTGFRQGDRKRQDPPATRPGLTVMVQSLLTVEMLANSISVRRLSCDPSYSMPAACYRARASLFSPRAA